MKNKLIIFSLLTCLLLLSACTVANQDNKDVDNEDNVEQVQEDSTFQAEISNFTFSETITIKAGESITWTNNDTVNHTVTFDEIGFESAALAKNDTYTQEFIQPGTYTYHCSFHPNMTGTVVVE